MRKNWKLSDDRGITFAEILITITVLAVLGTPLIVVLIESAKMNAKSLDKQYISTYLDSVCQEIEMGNYEKTWVGADIYSTGANYFNNKWKCVTVGLNQRYEDTTRKFVKLDDSGNEENYELLIETKVLNDANKLGSYSSFGYKNYYSIEFNASEIIMTRYVDAIKTAETTFEQSNMGSITGINDFSFVFSDNGFNLYGGSDFSSEISFSGRAETMTSTYGNYGYFGFGENLDENVVTRNIRIINNRSDDLDISLYNISETDAIYGNNKNWKSKKVNVFYYSEINPGGSGDDIVGTYPTKVGIKYDNNIELHDLKNLTGSGTIDLDTKYVEIVYNCTIITKDNDNSNDTLEESYLLNQKVSKMYKY